jgi:hypothetical protein
MGKGEDAMTLPIVTVAEFHLPIQGWAGRCEPTPSKMERPVGGSGTKPSNGFFTCTWDPEKRTTAWLAWCRANSKRNPEAEGRQLWTLTLCESATLCVIDSVAAFERLVKVYPDDRSKRGIQLPEPNWYKMADPVDLAFDGVHITDEAVRTGIAAPPGKGFTGWDVESTLWFVWSFTSPKHEGLIDKGWNVAG